MSATGGTAPYTWSLNAGSLPAGMSLTPAGLIEGTPVSTPQLFSFTIRARDANNCVADLPMTLRVKCASVTLTPATLADAKQFQPYTPVTIQAAGGNAPYSFTVSTGQLPAGMTLSNAGVLGGTPSAVPGDYSFTLRATDNSTALCTGERAYTLRILCPDITITPAGQVTTMMHQAATPVQFTAAGANPTVTWSHTGTLPSGRHTPSRPKHAKPSSQPAAQRSAQNPPTVVAHP
jgi:hypothetical protein